MSCKYFHLQVDKHTAQIQARIAHLTSKLEAKQAHAAQRLQRLLAEKDAILAANATASLAPAAAPAAPAADDWINVAPSAPVEAAAQAGVSSAADAFVAMFTQAAVALAQVGGGSAAPSSDKAAPDHVCIHILS